jgi:hypothetical protein
MYLNAEMISCSMYMQPSTPEFGLPMLRMGSMAFLAGLIINVISTPLFMLPAKI